MAQHGYLREYDEGWGRDDDRDRERSWRDDDDRERAWRGGSRERNSRDEDYSDSGDRNRNFMLGDRNRSWDRNQDRGFMGRLGDEPRSWFRDDDRQYRGTHQSDWDRHDHGSGSYGRDRSAFRGGGDWERSPRNFSSHQDDHYRSWRDRQMSALDQDYQDYCREREQQFHQDFDSWRRNRQSRGSGSQQQSQQGGNNAETAVAAEEELTLTRAISGQGNTPSAEDAATLGTNNSENSGVGRGKRQI